MEPQHPTSPAKRYRYKRPPVEQRKRLNFNATPRYARILHHAYTHKYVTAATLTALLHLDTLQGKLQVKQLKEGEQPSLTLTHTQNAIRKLWQHGYLEKRLSYITTAMGQGGQPDIYILGKLGAAYISEQLGLFENELQIPQLPRLDAPHRGMPAGDMTRLLHQVETSDVLAALQLSAQLSEKYQVIYFCHDGGLKHTYTVTDPVNRQLRKLYINPDGFVILEERTTGRRINLCLEIDRGTETHKRWQNKVLGYYALTKTEKSYDFLLDLYAERLTPSADDVPQHWVDNMIVVTVASSSLRAERLAQTTQKALENQRGSGMFWFARSEAFRFTAYTEHQSDTGKAYQRQVVEPDLLRQLAVQPVFQKALLSAAGQRFALSDM